ncbi:alkaline phytoceramidase [Stereum hirsutum FP-91666 SS1]|uniref:alkaline phytoceramidase n=1 Tax=Stereum hirsutum (strain FP-91666) TaxID=721885 RepID=UPI0004410316|nr:alkaline phytoceramidase [Stereum hirsutum FP-91666 SS1]EIM91264.1 alkaline phytoceramidase [Stereum hirsutum FP-91666 SS1]
MASKIVGEAARILGDVDSDGIWGPVTATLDWCEANYQFSHYIAEMANSLSNLITVWFAVKGARQTSRYDLPRRYQFYWAGLLLVGLGSFAFHATLLYGPQLADELPMIYVASWSCFLLYDTQPGFNLRNRRSTTLLFAMAAFDILFTASYFVYRNPIYHQFIFACTILTTAGRVTYLVHSSSEQTTKIPAHTKQTVLKMFWTGAAMFSLAFIIWNLDNVFCGTLTQWKRKVGWPFAFLLEGHSWWHALTASGVYLMMEGVIYMTLLVKDNHQKYGLEYTRVGWPYVVRIPSGSVDGKPQKR